MAKIKDTDYLFLSAFIRAKEAKSVTMRDIDRILAADSLDSAIKFLAERGYGDMSFENADELERKISAHRSAVMDELYGLAPDKNIVDAFRIKYDYHNAKVLIKAEAAGTDGTRLLSDAGRIKAEHFEDLFLREAYSDMSTAFAAAVKEARATLGKTRDPQASDVILDTAYYAELKAMAERSKSKFLKGYAALLADVANIKTAVRAEIAGYTPEKLSKMLVVGGNVDKGRIVDVISRNQELTLLFVGGAAGKAAQCADAARKGSGMSAMEHACDDMITDYLKNSNLIAFGETVLIYYICRIESELTAVRILLTGMKAQLPAETIKERLRGIDA